VSAAAFIVGVVIAIDVKNFHLGYNFERVEENVLKLHTPLLIITRATI